MLIRFTKMHGNGNDFVLIDNMSRELVLDPERVRRIARRHFGVGCDQLLVAEPARSGAARVAMHIYNTDGSRAGHCGNGLRAFAVFAHEHGLVSGDSFPVEVPAGTVTARLLGGGEVHTTMGRPRFEPSEIPLCAPRRQDVYELEAEGERLRFAALSMGNPHAVVRVEDVDAAPVSRLGPLIQGLAAFPEGVNVGFMQVMEPARVRLRVYERGVGETLACGSGACAAVVAGISQGLLARQVRVELPGGPLQVSWPEDGAEVELSGPTTHVFNGEMEL